MSKRKLIRMLALAGAAVVVAGVVVLWPRPNRITAENFAHIQKGMTQAEVEAILGPPGDYRTGPTVTTEPSPDWGFLAFNLNEATARGWRRIDRLDSTVGIWQSDEGHACVFLSPQVVAIKCFDRATKQESGPLDYLLWRAKRQWHRWFP